MSKTIRHTIWVSVLLTGGALVTACHSSSDQDQSAQKTSVKGAKETAHSKVAQRATHAKAEPHAEVKTSDGKPSNTASGYATYGDSAAGAGITAPSDIEKPATGSTLRAGTQARAGQ